MSPTQRKRGRRGGVRGKTRAKKPPSDVQAREDVALADGAATKQSSESGEGSDSADGVEAARAAAVAIAADAKDTREPEHSVATAEAKMTHEDERSVNSAASSGGRGSGSSSAASDESEGEDEVQRDTEYPVHSIVDRRPAWSGDEYEYFVV
jgi:hypothetical protein